MFICRSAVSVVIFILQMSLHNIYISVLFSLTYFPIWQLAMTMAPGNCRFKWSCCALWGNRYLYFWWM